MTAGIAQKLTGLAGRKLLVPFITVGYPTLAMSRDLALAAIDAGADMLELGIPFSDPLADGPQVQLSSQVALQNGVTIGTVLDTAARIRGTSNIPLIAMGYYNPIQSRGTQQLLRSARTAGIDGLIVPDLPPEEAFDYRSAANALGLSTIFLVAPTTSRERRRLIEKCCTDFVYAVTVTGVTGAGRQFKVEVDSYLAELRSQLHKPIVAGFGVSSAESAARLCRHVDGVVIGSELIRIVESSRRRQAATGRVARFLAGVKARL